MKKDEYDEKMLSAENFHAIPYTFCSILLQFLSIKSLIMNDPE